MKRRITKENRNWLRKWFENALERLYLANTYTVLIYKNNDVIACFQDAGIDCIENQVLQITGVPFFDADKDNSDLFGPSAYKIRFAPQTADVDKYFECLGKVYDITVNAPVISVTYSIKDLTILSEE